MAIDIVVVISVAEGMATRFGELMRPLAEATRSEPGCTLFEAYGCQEQPDQVVLIERWADRAAIDEHMGQPYTVDFVAAARDLLVATEVRTLTSIGSDGAR